MQSAFVLCRLFHKPDEKNEGPKYDEIEQNGSSHTTTKSFPDDISSDLLQETATSGMHIEKQSEGIKSLLTDKCDNVTPNGFVINESSGNSHTTSDAEEHIAEETTIEVRSGFFFFCFCGIFFLCVKRVYYEHHNDMLLYFSFYLL